MALSADDTPDKDPIPALTGDRYEGPDLRDLPPVTEMLADLRRSVDLPTYVRLWRTCAEAIGGWLSVRCERDGTEHLEIGLACDIQARHRSIWLNALTVDLKSDPERREFLINELIREGGYLDERPANPRQTTRAIRRYLEAGGRILISPEDELTQGGSLPHWWVEATSQDIATYTNAVRTYYAVKRRWRSQSHIRRAVKMLGKLTSHGWWVLEFPVDRQLLPAR